MPSKGKIILTIIVVYFAIFAFINVNKEKKINKEIINKVVYVKNGKLDKKNEGKLVIVSGKISYDKLVTFDELKKDFGTIKINRKVEDYVKYYDETTKEEKYKWKERLEPLNNKEKEFLSQVISSEKISQVNIGDYKLDSKGLKLIPTDKYYTGQEEIEGLITKGIDYTTDPWEENLKEGDIKLTYKYYNIKKNPYISILAVQKGSSFIPYRVDKKNNIYQLFIGKIDNKEKLIKQLNINLKKTKKGKVLFIIMIITTGLFLIIDNKKK